MKHAFIGPAEMAKATTQISHPLSRHATSSASCHSK